MSCAAHRVGPREHGGLVDQSAQVAARVTLGPHAQPQLGRRGHLGLKAADGARYRNGIPGPVDQVAFVEPPADDLVPGPVVRPFQRHG